MERMDIGQTIAAPLRLRTPEMHVKLKSNHQDNYTVLAWGAPRRNSVQKENPELSRTIYYQRFKASEIEDGRRRGTGDETRTRAPIRART